MEQARHPWLYEKCKVPDTLDGRFEMLVLHMFLFLRTVRKGSKYPEEYEDFSQAMLELMFDDMDQALREMGVGDMGVGKRVKAMGEALFGRFDAYEAALHSKQEVYEALIRNVYGTVDKTNEDEILLLQGYLGGLQRYFAKVPASSMVSGILHLPEPKKILQEYS